MIPRSLITKLVALGLFLPVIVCVLLGIGGLLAAMGDVAGSRALQHVRLAVLVLWVIDLVGLLMVLGMQQMGPPPSSPNESPPAE